MKVTDAKVRCNGGTSASLNATVKAGDSIVAKWTQWTHEQGPVMVWLYKCAGDFKSCDGSQKAWFKIDQMGMTAPPLSGKAWGAGIVYSKKQWESKIPASLASGNYLIRHEIIALHQANTPQFYAECAQITVTGSGTASPAASYLASIPGYAPQSDPGITVSLPHPVLFFASFAISWWRFRLLTQEYRSIPMVVPRRLTSAQARMSGLEPQLLRRPATSRLN
jgi:hypothetical protein